MKMQHENIPDLNLYQDSDKQPDFHIKQILISLTNSKAIIIPRKSLSCLSIKELKKLPLSISLRNEPIKYHENYWKSELNFNQIRIVKKEYSENPILRFIESLSLVQN